MTTQHKPIKRTVTKLDTSGQIDLFTKDMEVETRATRRPERVCFIDLGPSAIKLGGCPRTGSVAKITGLS